MDRRDRILKFVRRNHRGIEIGPYFAPLLPKASGWNVLTLDVFDFDELRQRALDDPSIPPEGVERIEPVDLLGPAHLLDQLVQRAGHKLCDFDFCVSSHNLEHLPDPIRFLQAVERVLKPGGVLSMAIPDYRVCFDAVRPFSTTGAVLEAYLEARDRPSPRQEFENATLTARHFLPGNTASVDFTSHIDTESFEVVGDPVSALERWRARLNATATDYVDAHCWAFSPASLEAILYDIRLLGLTSLETLEISNTIGIEFVTHLRLPVAKSEASRGERSARYARHFEELRQRDRKC